MKNQFQELRRLLVKSRYIKSPLNYIGGKYKILDQIIPLFPKGIETFVDLFGGGFNVGINVEASKIIYNDNISDLVELMKYFYNNSFLKVNFEIEECINSYNLTKENKDGYLKLRETYNEKANKNKRNAMFFSLIAFSFNHQIRFNNDLKYNNTFGKMRSSYNENMRDRLCQFIDILSKKNVVFVNSDFYDFDISNLGSGDFVYCDPPYLITTGSYNDGKRGYTGWGETEERKLLEKLDILNSSGVRFALSNVTKANTKTNGTLIKWANKYNIHYIKNDFNNSNYHRKNKDDIIEVVITNY